MNDIKTVLDDINTIFAKTATSRTGDIPEKNKIKKTPVNSNKELKQLLETDYAAAYEKYLDNKAIFRGVRKGVPKHIGNYAILKPGLKTAEDTKNNLYTRLFSGILPSWKGYPPRNRSFICTTNTAIAYEFTSKRPTLNEWKNNIYVVFPKNGADIAICPTSDIWWAFSTIKKLNLEKMRFKSLINFQDVFIDFIEFISLIIYDLIVKDMNKEYSNNNNMNKYLKLVNIRKTLYNALEYGGSASIVAIFRTLSNYLNKYINKIITIINRNDPILSKYNFKDADKHDALFFLEELKKYNTTNLLKYLDIVLNAETNGFKKVKIENYNIKSSTTRNIYETGLEVWTDSECLFVNRLFLESLK